jgi:hypothetical protein
LLLLARTSGSRWQRRWDEGRGTCEERGEHNVRVDCITTKRGAREKQREKTAAVSTREAGPKTQVLLWKEHNSPFTIVD